MLLTITYWFEGPLRGSGGLPLHSFLSITPLPELHRYHHVFLDVAQRHPEMWQKHILICVCDQNCHLVRSSTKRFNSGSANSLTGSSSSIAPALDRYISSNPNLRVDHLAAAGKISWFGVRLLYMIVTLYFVMSCLHTRTALLLRTRMKILRADKLRPLFWEIILALPIAQFKKKVPNERYGYYLSIDTQWVFVGHVVWTSQPSKVGQFSEKS